MEKTFNQPGSVSPVAYIAKSKQRVKQYGDTVYLKDGDEFEIELFNPTQTKVTARIEINNTKIGPGLVLRPGERTFLDRYMQEARKFLFETYVVNGESKEVAKAIAKNGDVVIKFHKEKKEALESLPFNNMYNPNIFYLGRGIYNTPGVYYSGSGSGTISTTNLKGNITNTISASSFVGASSSVSTYTSQVQPENFDFLGVMDMDKEVPRSRSKSKSIAPKEIETGRVEKGSHSNTVFDADYSKFEENYTWIVEWKLLPESRKEITTEDLVQYCTGCGRKRKKGEIFCPKDGIKF